MNKRTSGIIDCVIFLVVFFLIQLVTTFLTASVSMFLKGFDVSLILQKLQSRDLGMGSKELIMVSVLSSIAFRVDTGADGLADARKYGTNVLGYPQRTVGLCRNRHTRTHCRRDGFPRCGAAQTARHVQSAATLDTDYYLCPCLRTLSWQQGTATACRIHRPYSRMDVLPHGQYRIGSGAALGERRQTDRLIPRQ